jgi:two-component system, chemotaxis family, protein-glutamate methylesterase/glutaminase
VSDIAAPGAPVRVLLCDDSATVRAAMARVLEADPQIRVVGRAGDGRAALDMLREAKPEVVLLDLEMPVMDGMTALPLLLRSEPRPAVIVASALTQRGAAAAMAALRAGAVDYVPKPAAAGGGLLDAGFRTELVAKVKGWARIGKAAATAPARPLAKRPGVNWVKPRAIAIGCSTGGPQALAELVRRLDPVPDLPICIVQHMPAGFTAMLADHLTRLGGPPCAEARDGEVLRKGRLYLAPGDRHFLVERRGGDLVALLTEAPPENFCRPAVDPLLRSLVAATEGQLVVAILTGMGHDGLAGCRGVTAAGGIVLAQDEASSVVWGMPGAVVKAGLATEIGPPSLLAERLVLAAHPTRGRA